MSRSLAPPTFLRDACFVLNSNSIDNSRDCSAGNSYYSYDNNNVSSGSNSTLSRDSEYRIDEETLLRARRNENCDIRKLDFAILNLLRNIFGDCIHYMSSNIDELDTVEIEEGEQYDRQFILTRKISWLLVALGYRRKWNRSSQERLFVLSWLIAEFNFWRKCIACESSEAISVNANNTNNQASRTSARSCVFSHSQEDSSNNVQSKKKNENINDLVSLYGKVTHQLRKYKHLDICLEKNKQNIAKSFQCVPGIKGHGSSLLYELDIDFLLSNIDESLKKKEDSIRRGSCNNLKVDRRFNSTKDISKNCSHNYKNDTTSLKNSSNRIKSQSKVEKEDRRNSLPATPVNSLNYDDSYAENIEPTMSERTHEKIINDLEIKLYNMKKFEIEILRNRESECTFFRWISATKSLQIKSKKVSREEKGSEVNDTKKEKKLNNQKNMQSNEYKNEYENENEKISIDSNLNNLNNKNDDSTDSKSHNYDIHFDDNSNIDMHNNDIKDNDSNKLHYRNQLNNYLLNSIEMTSELEEAIGLILKGNYLTREEMYDLTVKVDLNLYQNTASHALARNCDNNNIGDDKNDDDNNINIDGNIDNNNIHNNIINNNNIHNNNDNDNRTNGNNKNNKNNELINEIIMSNNFNYPLFRFYQNIFHEKISPKNEELSSLRFQHKNIIQKTASVCSTYSPFQFIFYPTESSANR